jgi:hypothetical protein
MKQLSLITLFIIFFNSAQGQDVKVSEYIGTLQLSTKQLITYKLNINEKEDGKFEGTSVTDIYGKNRTQSSIKGTLNTKTKKISFYEIQNISTKSTSGKDEFCYVNVLDARIKSIGGKTIIEGTFTGKYPDGKTCGKGNIYLISTMALKELNNELALHNEDSLKLVKDKINNLLSKSEENYLRRNEVLSVGSASNAVTLDIWDGGGEEDNDEVYVLVNNKKMGETIDIKRERKTITIELDSIFNEIKIVAVNEGKWKPCTANILLKDGTKHTPIVTVLKKGEAAMIEIKKLN